MVQQIQQKIQKKRETKSPRSMRLKIQKSMMVILAVTLVLFYVILSVILYNQNMSIFGRKYGRKRGISVRLSIFQGRNIWSRWTI